MLHNNTLGHSTIFPVHATTNSITYSASDHTTNHTTGYAVTFVDDCSGNCTGTGADYCTFSCLAPAFLHFCRALRFRYHHRALIRGGCGFARRSRFTRSDILCSCSNCACLEGCSFSLRFPCLEFCEFSSICRRNRSAVTSYHEGGNCNNK